MPSPVPQQHEQYIVQLQNDGSLALPESVYHHLDLQPGERLVLTPEPDGSLRLISLRTQLQNLRGIYKDVAPGISLADELIRERRGEAQRETQQ